MAGKLTAAVLVLAACVCSRAQAQTPGWMTAFLGRSPSAIYNGGDKGRFLVQCSPNTWALGVMVPAGDLSINGLVAAEIHADDVIQLHLRGGNPGGAFSAYGAGTGFEANDEEKKAAKVVTSLLNAKRPFSVRIDSYIATFPIEGFAAAMAPLLATCGDPGKFFQSNPQAL
jgi:hypothetical protein